MKVDEIDKNLPLSLRRGQKQRRGQVQRATLLAFRNGIKRYLNTSRNNLGVRPSQEPRFSLSNKILDAKTLERGGLQSITQKPTIEQHYLAKIKQSNVLSLSKPSSLLRNVWFIVSFYWFRRGLQGQRNLQKLSCFSFKPGFHIVCLLYTSPSPRDA